MVSQPCLFTNTLEDKSDKHYKMEDSKENMSTIIVVVALDEKSHCMPIHLIFHYPVWISISSKYDKQHPKRITSNPLLAFVLSKQQQCLSSYLRNVV